MPILSQTFSVSMKCHGLCLLDLGFGKRCLIMFSFSLSVASISAVDYSKGLLGLSSVVLEVGLAKCESGKG